MKMAEHFIVEVANPFDLFIDVCYQQKFEKKTHSFVLGLNSAGFHTKISVLIIGSLAVVH